MKVLLRLGRHTSPTNYKLLDPHTHATTPIPSSGAYCMNLHRSKPSNVGFSQRTPFVTGNPHPEPTNEGGERRSLAVVSFWSFSIAQVKIVKNNNGSEHTRPLNPSLHASGVQPTYTGITFTQHID